ncbi:DUF3581 domain-containing protein [Psychromonas aquatilis]|uniref:DUF3581 domain-containing protein n=1 Tax=Psychromonas aquatilis TaxID=2005072 RepID=A0ABU9GTW8_9GAMM
MLLDPYYSKQDKSVIISAEQASQFAKKECQDFNPIHDPNSKRFCVPGDLLFALAINEYGISESMRFTFTNMVGDNMPLNFPVTDAEHIVVTNDQGKSVLEINRKGQTSHDLELIESLIKKYVVFSGQNFPTLLMPLMEKHQVMFNPARPLVMYNSMNFEFNTLSLTNPLHVELAESKLEVEAKRANEFLHFDIFDGDNNIGHGVKTVVVGGLKPYDHDAITAFADNYLAMRNAF